MCRRANAQRARRTRKRWWRNCNNYWCTRTAREQQTATAVHGKLQDNNRKTAGESKQHVLLLQSPAVFLFSFPQFSVYSVFAVLFCRSLFSYSSPDPAVGCRCSLLQLSSASIRGSLSTQQQGSHPAAATPARRDPNATRHAAPPYEDRAVACIEADLRAFRFARHTQPVAHDRCSPCAPSVFLSTRGGATTSHRPSRGSFPHVDAQTPAHLPRVLRRACGSCDAGHLDHRRLQEEPIRSCSQLIDNAPALQHSPVRSRRRHHKTPRT